MVFNSIYIISLWFWLIVFVCVLLLLLLNATDWLMIIMKNNIKWLKEKINGGRKSLQKRERNKKKEVFHKLMKNRRNAGKFSLLTFGKRF